MLLPVYSRRGNVSHIQINSSTRPSARAMEKHEYINVNIQRTMYFIWMLMTSTHTLNYVFLIFLLCISDWLYLKCKHNDTSQCVYLNMRFCFQSLFLIQIYYTCCHTAYMLHTACRYRQHGLQSNANVLSVCSSTFHYSNLLDYWVNESTWVWHHVNIAESERASTVGRHSGKIMATVGAHSIC